MANLMSMVKLHNKPSRDGFDYSRKVEFSAKVGELLPMECVEIIPGDYAEIRKQHFTRTQPVNTAAYTRLREYYDWFFVPTSLLWSSFNQFVIQADNPMIAKNISSNSQLSENHPYITTKGVQDYLTLISEGLNESVDSIYMDNIFGYKRAYQSAKLLSYLGYGNYYRYAGDESQPKNIDKNVKLNPFPLLAYQKIYQDYYRNSQWEKSYAPACNIDYITSDSQHEIDLMQLDYKVENMLDLRYANWNKDFFMGLLPDAQYGDLATVDFSSIETTEFNYTPLLAKDNGLGEKGYLSVGSQARTNDPIELMSSYAGSAAKLRLSKTSIDSLATSLGVSSEQLSSRFSILALRIAESSQKWKEITQSNRLDYPSQVKAHFGVEPSDSLSHVCRFIDGGVSSVDIDEVQNQNLADDNAATIGGKGIGTGDSTVKFESKVHGYLMCIYHCKPILDFKLDGIKKRNLKYKATDYAIPEYDKTGMVRVNPIELNYSSFDWSQYNDNWLESLLGYAPQYYEYKVQYDEVLGAFAHGNMTHWTAPITREYLESYFRSVYDRFGVTEIDYRFFKIPPSVLNPIFVQQVTHEFNDLDTDQLAINCSFDIKLVRNLDRNGLPY